jgi:hypothetical protein
MCRELRQSILPPFVLKRAACRYLVGVFARRFGDRLLRVTVVCGYQRLIAPTALNQED